jgi:GNAT superfamily N-acetyltransferase
MEESLVNDIYEIKSKNQTWYYFNRLNVPEKIRNRGIATELMNELVDWADLEEINILLDINPYGDMSYNDLKKFYKKFGFKVKKKSLIRLYKF